MPNMPGFGAIIWVAVIVVGTLLYVFLRAQGRRTRL